MIVVSGPIMGGVQLPNTVTGTGTTAKTFGPQVYAPGSSRMDGQEIILRASGNLSMGIASNSQFILYANYPTLATGAAQYPVATITNAVANTTGGANIALYNANNNFVIGQYVTVANVSAALNGTVGPLIVANSTAFAGQVAAANVANAAAITLTNAATATIAAQPLYLGVNTALLNVGGILPWMAEIRVAGDQGSGLLVAYGTDQTINLNVGNNGPNIYQAITSTGLCNPVPGVNFKNEPPVIFTAAVSASVSNAANTWTLKQFFLEE